MPDDVTALTVDALPGYVTDIVFGDNQESDGIVFYPPADAIYYFEVWGRFYHPALTNERLENWWTFNHYGTLLHSALRELETDYRNTEGANDWEASVLKDLRGITFDDAEEQAEGIPRMEG